MKVLSLTLLMAVVCAGMTFAQQQGQRRSEKVKATQEERVPKRMEMMAKSLKLTPDQVAKLQAIHEQFAKENRQEMKAKREAYDAQVKSILTPEQYEQYQKEYENEKRSKVHQSKLMKSGNHQGKWNKEKKKSQNEKK